MQVKGNQKGRRRLAGWFSGLVLGLSLVLPVAAQADLKKGSAFVSADDAVMAAVRQWQQTGIAKPLVSDDGTVLYPFGEYLPTLTCGVMHACSIDLQAGETLIDSTRGDTHLWTMATATSQEAGGKILHVVMKPKLNGIETNLMLFTDRRTYHIKLVSPLKETDYMNHIGFYYPDDVVQHWSADNATAQAEVAAQQRKADLPSVSLDKIDWGYTIRGGSDSQRPVRVGNDGRRVWIQMPASMDTTEVPTIVELDDNGNPADVSSRRVGRDGEFFLVDKLFKRAELLWGGSDGAVTTVKIIWNKEKKWYW
ncbi:TrbG/VirB9 family P-type conjugative transfer protein [Burkholderia sp. LMG 13014]|uniref:TrbG/VirB9 family P-type conjugative transfer protein n=1 Tax=Burkholderia sp. LMG 13014 TaxID=2709306 RepID=UPI0019655A0B|nr:TrbG/VirB9 family P-type conjugative transfer protein [Burkholderia sp. LMG 13014]